MTENSMMPCSADRWAVNGSRIAARVNILTPGMAPNSMPPITPPRNIRTPSGSLNRVTVPSRKLEKASIVVTRFAGRYCSSATSQLPKS